MASLIVALLATAAAPAHARTLLPSTTAACSGALCGPAHGSQIGLRTIARSVRRRTILHMHASEGEEAAAAEREAVGGRDDSGGAPPATSNIAQHTCNARVGTSDGALQARRAQSGERACRHAW